MKICPHIQILGPLPKIFEELLLVSAKIVDLDDPLSLTKEEAFFDACNRYDAETEFFNEKNNFYSSVLPSAELARIFLPYHEYLLESFFPDHVVFRSQVVRNIPGAIVNPHIDPRLYHRLSHRVHAVLRTNDRSRHVYFNEKNQDVEYLKMNAGFIYDFDNISPHAAFNLGDTGRLHIITDIIPGPAYRQLRPLFLKNPNHIPPEVEDEYYHHLRAINARYGGKAGLRATYEDHLRSCVNIEL